MATTIKLKNGSGAPLASDLVQGEPAFDLTNKRLYTEDSGGTVIEVGTTPTSLTTTGTVTFGSLSDGAITITAFVDEDNMASDSATLVPTQQSVKAYVDSQVTAQDLDFQGDSGGALSIDLDSETLTIAGGTGIDTTGATNTLTVAIDSTVTTLTGTQTLTNKTLTAPVISSISNTGTLTLPTSTDTLVGRATTDTLINKTLTSPVISSISNTGTLTLPTSTDVLVGRDTTDTLTNKTLTSPVINTGVSGTAVLDDDTFATASATTLATSESIKAYVDAQVDTADQLSELSDVNITTPADGALLFYDTGTTKWIDNVVSGDITIADTGVAAISSGVIVNADVNASAAISVSKTALVDGTGLTLTGDTLSVDASQTQITAVGTIGTGTWQGTAIADAYVADNLTISGGTVDNTVIGGTTAAAGTFTTFTSTGIDDNATSTAVTIDSDGTVRINGAPSFANNLFSFKNSTNNNIIFSSNSAFGGNSILGTTDAGADAVLGLSGSNVQFYTSTTERMRIGSGGDVSFYEDTGTTAKFFWDASTERLGIGTASPITPLDVFGKQRIYLNNTNVGNASSLQLTQDGTGDAAISFLIGATTEWLAGVDNSDSDKFKISNITGGSDFTATGMTIDSSGNVGIGTASPTTKLQVTGSGSILRVSDDTSTSGTIELSASSSLAKIHANTYSAAVPLAFEIASSEKMRIDSSGNVGIGTDSPFGELSIKSASPQVYLETVANGNVQINFNETADQLDVMVNNTNGKIAFGTNSTERMRIDSSGTLIHKAAAVFNEDGGDSDFRVESDINTHTLFVDASLNRIGLFESSPQQAVSFGGPNIFEWRTGSQAMFRPSNNTNDHRIVALTDQGMDVVWGGAVTTSMQKWQNGNAVTFNDDSNDQDFRVESNGNAFALFVDASENLVTVGSSGGYGNLQVVGDNAASEYRTLFVTSASDITKGVAIAYDYANDYGVITAVDAGTGWRPLIVKNTSLNVDQSLVANDSGGDNDFRVESASSTHALFVDATNGNIGINDSAPSSTLASGVSATGRVLSIASGGTTAISIRSTDAVNDRNAILEMLSSGNGGSNNIIVYGDTDTTPTTKSGLIFQGYHNGSRVQRAELDWSGQWKNEIGAIFNESGADSDFRVESDSNTHMLFVDAGNNTVSVGGSTSLGTLSVISTVDGTEAAPHFGILGAASNYQLNMWLDATAAYIGQNSALRSLRLYSSAETAGVELSAGATSWSTFSDERLKENVEPVENALQSLSGLRTVKYHLKDVDGPEDKKKIGVIAQDLVGVLDEVIDPTFRPDDDTEYMGVRYTELVPVLIKAIQEQQDLIESLTARVVKLEFN